MFIAAEEFPLPSEYRHMPFDEASSASRPRTSPSARWCSSTAATSTACRWTSCSATGSHILNIDHHHDNTRFGTVNLVNPPASCTAEIVWELRRNSGVEITPPIAEALYVGLVTDTGQVHVQEHHAAAHRMAAELIESGVDAHASTGACTRTCPTAALQLLSRALARVERFDDGRAHGHPPDAGRLRGHRVAERDSEGIVDHLRAVQGTLVAALVRELLADDREGLRKVSLRATDGSVDVSRVAREFGGGGHRQAAGFTTAIPYEELVQRLRGEVSAQL